MEALEELDRIIQTTTDNEWESAEDQLFGLRAWIFTEAGVLLIELGESKRGFARLAKAFEHALQDDADLDGQYIQLCEIAYAYGEAGEQEQAIAIAELADEYHSAYRFYSHMVCFYMLIALGRGSFMKSRQERIQHWLEQALNWLGQADEKIKTIWDLQLRQALEACVDDALSLGTVEVPEWEKKQQLYARK